MDEITLNDVTQSPLVWGFFVLLVWPVMKDSVKWGWGMYLKDRYANGDKVPASLERRRDFSPTCGFSPEMHRSIQQATDIQIQLTAETKENTKNLGLLVESVQSLANSLRGISEQTRDNTKMVSQMVGTVETVAKRL